MHEWHQSTLPGPNPPHGNLWMDTRSLKARLLFYFVRETFNFSKRFYLNGLTAVPKEADNADIIMSSFYSPGNSP